MIDSDLTKEEEIIIKRVKKLLISEFGAILDEFYERKVMFRKRLLRDSGYHKNDRLFFDELDEYYEWADWKAIDIIFDLLETLEIFYSNEKRKYKNFEISIPKIKVEKGRWVVKKL